MGDVLRIENVSIREPKAPNDPHHALNLRLAVSCSAP